MQISASSTLTVYHDGQFWVGLAEHVEDGRYGAARIVFGDAPHETGLVDCNLPVSAFEPLAYLLIPDVPVFARIGVDGDFGVLNFEPGMPYIAERHLPTPPFVRIWIWISQTPD